MRNIDRVREFHTTYGQFINEESSLDKVDMKLALQRLNLISEEANELMNAVGNNDRLEILDALTDLEYVIDGACLTFGHFDLDEEIAAVEDPRVMQIEIQSYIHQFSTNLAIGYPLYMGILSNMMFLAYHEKDQEQVMLTLLCMKVLLDMMFKEYEFSEVREAAAIEVHESNMSKLDENGKPIYRESDGKVLKGPNYREPDLRKFLPSDDRKNSVAG